MIKSTEILPNLNAMMVDPNDQLTDQQRDNLKSWMSWFKSDIDFNEQDLVQIDPASDEKFGGHIMVVTHTFNWGSQGYVMILTKRKRICNYKVHFKNCVPVGKAKWVVDLDED